MIPDREEAARVNENTVGIVFTHEELFHQLERWLGAITPLGGACFLGGWVAMAAGALRADRPNPP